MSVTEYIGSRLGVEIVDRLVDPLLGGVYAGRSEDLSFRATLAPLAAAAPGHATLTGAAASLLPPAPAQPSAVDNSNKPPAPAPAGAAPAGGTAAKPAPVFVSLTTGIGALPEAVAKASGADVRTNAMVRALERTATGWRLTVGSAAEPEYLDADAVILATPAAPAARLLKDSAGEAAARLAEIPYASMAIVTLAFRAEALFQQQSPAQQRSGYLVPAVDGRAVKAVTFSTLKWPHLAAQAPVHIVRCSVGRSGDVAVLQRDDEDLAALAAAELAGAIGITADTSRVAGHPLGRRPAPVQRRPPGPRRGHPRGGRRAARPCRRAAPPTTASASRPACQPPSPPRPRSSRTWPARR